MTVSQKFTLSFLLALAIIVGVSAVLQEIVVYETAPDPTTGAVNPRIRSHSFTRNQRYVNLVLAQEGAGFNTARGACAKRGVWAVYAESNYAPFGNFHLLDAETGKGPVCVNMTNAPIQSIRPVASFAGLNVSQLSMFDNPKIEWGRQFDFGGEHLILPWPMTFSSYGFTGSKTWSFSPVVTGRDGSQPWLDTCVALPKGTPSQMRELMSIGGDVLTYRENTRITVQEIRAGCTGYEGQTIYSEYDITAFVQRRSPRINDAWGPPINSENSLGPMPPMGTFPPMLPMGSFPPMPPMGSFPPMPPMGSFPPMPPMGSFPPMPPMGSFPPMPPYWWVTPDQPPMAPPPAAAPNGPGLRMTLQDPNTGKIGELSFTGKFIRFVEPLYILDLQFTGTPAANWTMFPYVWGFTDTQCLSPSAPPKIIPGTPFPTGGFTIGC